MRRAPERLACFSPFCGFLQIHTETYQEVLDSILMAYRLAEDARG